MDAKSLTRNALRDIVNQKKKSELKDTYFVLQAIEVKQFSQTDNKKNIKQR